MSRWRCHGERAFERWLRHRRVPYVAVDEARRSLDRPTAPLDGGSIKNFDYLVTPHGGPNLLVDVKARRLDPIQGRLQNWVTRDDIDGLGRWQALLGPGHEAFFVFVYWTDLQPPDGWFEEIFVYDRRWYGLVAVAVDDYVGGMRPRSARWGTVHLSDLNFRALRRPLLAGSAHFSCGLATPVLC